MFEVKRLGIRFLSIIVVLVVSGLLLQVPSFVCSGMAANGVEPLIVVKQEGKGDVSVSSYGRLRIAAKKNGEFFQAYLMIRRSGDKAVIKETATSGDGYVNIRLPAGAYDIRVQDSWGAVQQPEIKFNGVMVSADQTIEKTASFQMGKLSISPMSNGISFQASIVLRKSGSNKVITRFTSPSDKPAEIEIVPGKYDVVVTDAWGVVQHPSVELKGITVNAGETEHRDVEFEGGIVELKTLKNGQPFQAEVFISDSSTGESITHLTTSQNGIAEIGLLPGEYDFQVEDIWREVMRPRVEIPNVLIESGRIVNHEALFESGKVRLSIFKNGSLFRAGVYISESGTREWAEHVTTSRGESLLLELPPGRYDFRVEDVWGAAGKPFIDIQDVLVAAGETVEREVRFQTGTLGIHAFKNGEPLRATVIVTDSATRARITRRTTSMEGVLMIELVPGKYDVRVEDDWGALGQPVFSFQEVMIHSGETIDREAAFESGFLEVTVVEGGAPFQGVVQVYMKDGAEPVMSTSLQDAIPVLFELTPGMYSLLVRDSSGAGDDKKFEDIMVRASLTRRMTIQF